MIASDPGYAEFVASGDARETSREVMEAIAHFAVDADHAVVIWEEGLGMTGPDSTEFWSMVTEGGERASGDFCWGAAGRAWWDGCDGCGCLGDRLIRQDDGRRLCQPCDSAWNS
jgi:hypothetical protein